MLQHQVRGGSSGQALWKAGWSHLAQPCLLFSSCYIALDVHKVFWFATLSVEPRWGRGLGNRDVSELLLACCPSPHFILPCVWARVHKTVVICKRINVNYQELSAGEEKKVKCLIFPGDICCNQISHSPSQECSIKYVIHSTRIYKTYCNSNLLGQIVFNYTYHLKKRTVLSS